MEIDIRTEGNLAVLIVKGPLTQGRAVGKIIKDLLQQGVREFILELDAVSDVDSEGMGELVQAYCAVKQKGGDLKLVGVPTRMSEMMSAARLLVEDKDTASPGWPDPFGGSLENPAWNPAIWLAFSVALIIVMIVIARLAGFGGS